MHGSDTWDWDDATVVPITDVFDLHSFAPRDMKAAVEAYLEAASEAGFKAVRIIHGRGIGVQREMVRTLLEQTPSVAAFSDAPAEAGGWGATIVTLNTVTPNIVTPNYEAETGSVTPPGFSTGLPSGE